MQMLINSTTLDCQAERKEEGDKELRHTITTYERKSRSRYYKLDSKYNSSAVALACLRC